MIKVSIIMPVYNSEKSVKKAIESVINQTFKDWELIIVDDGSTDDSLSVCKFFDDDRIRVLHQDNGGVSSARNNGLRNAKGEYIAFLDSDDYLAKDSLEKLYKPECNFILAGLSEVNSKGIITKQIKPSLIGKVSIKEVLKTFYKEQIETGIYGYVPQKLVKRSIIVDNNLFFDETIKLAEDLNFYLDIYRLIDEIFFVDYCGYYYYFENNADRIDDSKIDFIKQMEIRFKIKTLLTDFGCFTDEDEKDFFLRMSVYIYTVLNMKSKSYQSFKENYNQLKRLVQIVKCYDKKNRIGRVIKYYNKRKFKTLFIFFKVKNLIRK